MARRLRIFYPGATERTSAAERYETKGCIQLQLSAAPGTPGRGLLDL